MVSALHSRQFLCWPFAVVDFFSLAFNLGDRQRGLFFCTVPVEEMGILWLHCDVAHHIRNQRGKWRNDCGCDGCNEWTYWNRDTLRPPSVRQTKIRLGAIGIKLCGMTIGFAWCCILAQCSRSSSGTEHRPHGERTQHGVPRRGPPKRRSSERPSGLNGRSRSRSEPVGCPEV